MSEVTINCSCGLSWEIKKEHFYSLLFNHRMQGLASDCCDEIPFGVDYGGMEA